MARNLLADDSPGRNLLAAPTKDIEEPNALMKALTGYQAEAEETKGLPELHSSGLLSGEDALKGAAISPALLSSTDPNEIAKIITENFPNIGAAYQQAPDGSVYPVLRNNATGAATVINRPGISGFDVLQGLGLMAAYSPAGRASTVAGAAAKSALTETGIQGAQSTAGGSFDTEEIAMSAGLGAAGKAGEELISGVARGLGGKVPEDAADVITRGKAEGVPVMTTDVIEPETLVGKLARSTGEVIPFAGTGAQRAAQQKAREEALYRITGDVTPEYSEVVNSLRNKAGGIRKAAGDRLETIGRQMDEAGDFVPQRSIDAIDQEIAALTAPGRVVDQTTVDVLERYKSALEEGQTFTSMDTLRSDFREAVKGDRQSLPSRAQAASERVYKAFTDELTSDIAQNMSPRDASRWMKAKGLYANEMKTLKGTKLKNILDKGDVTPETVKTALLSKNQSELKALYSRLTNQGRQSARVTLLNNMIEQASKGQLTPDSFATQMKKHASQIGVFFRGEERKQLNGFRALLDATRRAQSASVATPTGQSLAGILGLAGGATVPHETIATGLTVAALARIYESAPVRNALLRISSVPKGSTGYDTAIREAMAIIQSASQAARSQVEK